MKKVVLSVVAAVAVVAVAAPAFAADMAVKTKPMVAPPPSPWDVAFGSALMTDYVFRGVTQSAHNPSVAAYFEPRYNINSDWQIYAGVSGESIKFANSAAAEIDFYGGVRPTFGPLALDFGIWEYYYPGGTCYGGGPLQGGLGSTACLAPPWASGNVAKKDASFYEVYAKATYTMGDWAFGPTFYYSPNFLNTGADGEYLSGIVKFTAPSTMALWNGQIGWYVSGEFGHQWFGTSDAFYGVTTTGAFPPAVGAFVNGIPEPDYNTWNVGLGFTWKVFTLDLRYTDTDLSKTECSAFTSDPGATIGTAAPGTINPLGTKSNWCGATFMAKLSADLTLGSLK